VFAVKSRIVAKVAIINVVAIRSASTYVRVSIYAYVRALITRLGVCKNSCEIGYGDCFCRDYRNR